MGATVVQIEIPDDLVQLIGSTEAAAEQAREALVIELSQHRITQGTAAELLGISRGEMIDVASRYEISSGMEEADELRQQIERIMVQG